MNRSDVAILLSYFLYHQVVLSPHNGGVVDAFVVAPSSASLMRTPTMHLVAPSDTSASDVFLLTTGLKGFIPQFPEFNLPFSDGGFNVTSLLLGIVGLYSALFFLVLFGVLFVTGPIWTCFEPILQYLEEQKDESKRERLGAFYDDVVSAVMTSGDNNNSKSVFDNAFLALSERLHSLDDKEYEEFSRIIVEQFTKAEMALIQRVFDFDLKDYMDEPEDLRQMLWHTSTIDLSKKLEEIMQKEFPTVWQKIDEGYLQETEEPWRPLVFLKCLFDLEKEKETKVVVQKLFSRTPYKDFLDYSWQTVVGRKNTGEDEPSSTA